MATSNKPDAVDGIECASLTTEGPSEPLNHPGGPGVPTAPQTDYTHELSPLDEASTDHTDPAEAFWATERAHAEAERGRQADPSACGTCRDRVAAGGQVKHDECAQRATLLPAPDAPSWELITGMTEEELRALPARFHIPVFMESSSPKLWVCAVCWGEDWVAQWPCKTAVEQGLRVFTADDYAETAAKRRAARVSELETQLAEARAELAKYVGHEPTIADEMAYLNHCLDAVRDVCDKAERQATRWENPLPVPEWVAKIRKAADGLEPRRSYPPALPWARLMDADDLEGFLADLADAASGDDDLTTLDEVEAAIGRWRPIAEAQHAHNTAPGPNAETGESR